MKVKCRRCDLCGAEMGGRTFQHWLKFKFLKAKSGYPDVCMAKYDFCDDCMSTLKYAVKRRTDEWKEEKSEKPKYEKEVLISDGKHYGVGMYVYDSFVAKYGWKVSCFDKIENVIYWKEIDKLPISQKEKK